ncbi:RNA polymerase sigma factor [Streptomyces sp. NPDC085665]|uniref:RNA polymerase sigma factor n=1 Tax=Streptomyces sp. NPDC085665 TaxID=3365735 RepID=UPI0037D4D476
MTDDEYDAYVRRTIKVWRRRAQFGGNLSPEDADEVASQLLSELYAHLDVIATEMDAHRFVSGRLRNRIIDVWRRNGRRRECEFPSDLNEEFDQCADAPRPESHPDEWMEFSVSQKIAQDMVNARSDDERTHLRLRLAGFKPAECARLLGIERNAERTRWTRLKERLVGDIEATTGDREAAE